MAAPLSEDIKTQVSTKVGEDFVKDYYYALDSRRNDIQRFYMSPTQLGAMPRITYNGETMPDPATFAARYAEMPKTRLDDQSINVHVMNASLTPLDAQARQKEKENNMSLLVQVSGVLKLHDRSEAPRGFSDSFVLVPNKEVGKDKGRGQSWAVQSQNFRLVT